MNFLTRQSVCECLHVNLRTSYRIVGASHSKLINSSELLAIVNDCRRGITEPLFILPSDLRTPEEMSAELNGALSPRKLLLMSRRVRRTAPHFRLNKQTTRFSSSRLISWLKDQSKTGECK